jgi:hypothetical protein
MVAFIVQWISMLWLVFTIVWLVAAFSSKRSMQRQSYGSRVVQGSLILVGMLFIFNFWDVFNNSRGWFTARLIPATPFWVLLGAALAVAGVLFCFWARAILGRNWSGTVCHQAGPRTYFARALWFCPPSDLHGIAGGHAGNGHCLRICTVLHRSADLRFCFVA